MSMAIGYLLRGAVVTAALVAVLSVTAEEAQAEEALRDAITGYMDFATYEAGIIMPDQMDQMVFDSAVIVDTRDAAQFAAGHIPGAINIEWRAVPGQLDELPQTGMVILYCNTGTLSAQAAFAARLLGRENVLMLQTGYEGWLAHAPYKPG
jgi:rhodanese-related sulfurtransferase